MGAILFVVVAFMVITVVPALLEDSAVGPAAEVVITVLRWPLLALGLLLSLAVLYRVAPDRDDPKWRWVSPGAIVAAVLWLVGSGLFSLYAGRFGSYDETYGSLGGVVVTMLWLFLTSYVVILGAELNAELERQTTRDTTVGTREPMGDREAYAADTDGPTAGELQATTSQANVG